MAARIQKVLARAGVGSRRQVEEWIRAGRLAINGVPATLGAPLGARDKVTLDGRPVRLRMPQSAKCVIAYHRSPGHMLASPESGDAGQLFDHLPRRAGRRWMPVSPLPPNDGGLELLTSDGDLAHALMRRLSRLQIEFALRVRGEPRADQLERLRAGALAEGETLRIESLEEAGGDGANRWYTLATRGGRARDVHRLCAAVGITLSRLLRVSIGPVKMDRSLARERSRALGAGETAELYAVAGLEPPELIERARRAPSFTARQPFAERRERRSGKRATARGPGPRKARDRSGGRHSGARDGSRR